jgi:hypothetical protein
MIFKGRPGLNAKLEKAAGGAVDQLIPPFYEKFRCMVKDNRYSFSEII